MVERILFALVVQRCLEPGSKLACASWVEERVALSSCPVFDDQAGFAAMGFHFDALGEITTGIFNRTANLLNLACDVIFVDTSLAFFCLDVADEEIELAEATNTERQGREDEPAVPAESGRRQYSKNSKDKLAFSSVA